MANLSITVEDGNNLTVDVTPQPATNIVIDRGVAGNGIESITLVDVGGETYLEIVYTNGTSEQLGPLETGVYFGVAPITITGNDISLADTAVTTGTYGSASETVTYTVDSKGRLTASQEQNIAITLSQITNAGTMAAQNANNVSITGGSITGTTVSGYVPTTTTISAGTGLSGGGDLSANRTLAIANTGVTAATYGSATQVPVIAVNAQGQATSVTNTTISITQSNISDAGDANGIATLDAGGTVPLSQIPASIQGGLNYQGTWNASTNTPTLTSSVGSKGYYYAVSVAGSTNLNGITDWNIGDLAVFNGTVWEQIDNTDAVTSVNGYTGTVVLTYTDVGAFPATTTTGTGNVVLQTSPTINTPTLSGATIDGVAPYTNYTPTTAPTYVEGRVFYDTDAKTLAYYNDNSQMTVNIGQENIVRVRNQTGSTISDGTVVYINGATGNTPTIAKAIATSFATADIIGVTTTSIANNGFGYATINGLVNGLDTSAFAEGDAVFLSATTAGVYTTTEPTRPNYSIQVGVILRANPSNGTLLVSVQIVSTETQHVIGTIAVDQGGTGQTTYTNGQLLIGNTTGNTLTKSTLTAGTGVSVTNGAGSITVTNTAPDQTVALTAGTGISTSGTYPNFTITNTAPSSGGTVTSITAGTGLNGGTITSSGTIDLANTAVTAGSYTNTNLTVDAQGRITAATSGAAGGVTSFSAGTTGLTPSTGTTGSVTLAGTLAIANGGTGQTTANTAFNALAPSQTSNSGKYLTTDGTNSSWATVNAGASLSNDTTTASNLYPIYAAATSGTPTTLYTSNAKYLYKPSTGELQASAMVSTNGINVNNATVSASYTIASGNNGLSVGPVTVASGQSVTVTSGQRWVIL